MQESFKRYETQAPGAGVFPTSSNNSYLGARRLRRPRKGMCRWGFNHFSTLLPLDPLSNATLCRIRWRRSEMKYTAGQYQLCSGIWESMNISVCISLRLFETKGNEKLAFKQAMRV